MAIIKLNNNALTSVTELPSGVGADPNTKIDLARLGLRVFANQNLAKQNSTSLSYDVLQDATGVTNLVNCSRDDNEFISTALFTLTGASTMETLNSNRQSDYTLSDNIPKYSTSGNFSNLFDGSHDSSSISNASLNYLHDSSGTLLSGTHYMRIDLGSGNQRAWSGLRMYHQNNTTQYGGTDDWVFQGSNDGTNWSNLYTFTWTHTDQGSDYYHDYAWTPTSAHRYIQITPSTSVTSSSNTWQRQWYWFSRTFSDTFNASGSFEGATITASSSTSKMGAVITYKNNAGTNALNSDLVLKLSADNGSNYSTATLVDNGDLDSTTKVASVSDVSVTAGTQLKYKIEFANQSSGSKECRVTGVSLQY